MATAEELRKEFTDLMNEQDIPHIVFDEEDNIVTMSFNDRNEGTMTLLVDFDENGDDSDSVHLVANRCAKCSKENIPAVLFKLNEINGEYRWIKFYLDIDDDCGWICADTDAQIYPGTAGEECVRCAFRMASIVDDALESIGDLIEESDYGKFLKMLSVAKMFK